MRRAPLAIVVAAVTVLGLCIGLYFAVRGSGPAPVVIDPLTSTATASPSNEGDKSPHARPRSTEAHPPVPEGGYKKFISPKGIEGKPFGTDPALRYPIPVGGFGAWTGREGTWPGEVEAFATESKLVLTVALEQRRSTLLQDRTADKAYLEELLGKPPTGEMLTAINQHASALHDATANIQVGAREGRLTDDAALQQTRAAEEAYRRGYLEATGLTEQQFDQFFSPGRPMP